MFCYCWLWLCELCLVFWQINPVFKLWSCCGDAYRKLEDLESDALWPSITLLHTHLNYFPFICLHFSSFSFFFSSPLHIHTQHINTQTWALLNCLNSMTVCMDSGAIIESALSHASDDLRLDFTKWKKTKHWDFDTNGLWQHLDIGLLTWNDLLSPSSYEKVRYTLNHRGSHVAEQEAKVCFSL